MNPLISVIIPVYNVEAFVEKSLLSVVNQTYQNLEIIVVNDGSTDHSLEICKKIAAIDSRIRIISQQNQGLSAARNTGIDACSGEYIMFLDSDDCLANGMIEFLELEIRKNQVKIAICGFKKVKNQEPQQTPKYDDTEIIKCDDAIERMLLGEWWSACMKLYHHSIFTKLRFPHGRIVEDYAIMVQILEQCETISYNPTPLYYYLTREDSITTRKLTERNFDEILNMEDVVKYVEQVHPKFYQQAERNLGASLIKLFMLTHLDQSQNFIHKLPWLQSVLKKHEKSLLQNVHFPGKQKLIIWFLGKNNQFGARIFANSYQWYKRQLK